MPQPQHIAMTQLQAIGTIEVLRSEVARMQEDERLVLTQEQDDHTVRVHLVGKAFVIEPGPVRVVQ